MIFQNWHVTDTKISQKHIKEIRDSYAYSYKILSKMLSGHTENTDTKSTFFMFTLVFIAA